MGMKWKGYLFYHDFLIYIVFISTINYPHKMESVGEEAPPTLSGFEPPRQKMESSGGALTSESIQAHAQAVIDEIEVKRKNDETLITG